MSKSYTLNRFYKGAKDLLEKHNSIIARRLLRCQFSMEGCFGATRLSCYINYRNEEEGYLTGFFGSGSSPAKALIEFEESILRDKIDREWEEVSVVVTDKLSEEDDQSEE